MESAQDELQESNNAHVTKCDELSKRISRLTLDEDALKNDDDAVNFYTGLLNFGTLILLVKFLTRGLTIYKGSLSSFQEILLVLMKLRLNLEQEDLAFHFEINQSTVSRIFHKWIVVMAEKLKFLIRWPTEKKFAQLCLINFVVFFHDVCALLIVRKCS